MIDANLFKPKLKGESDKFSLGVYRVLKKYPGIRIVYYSKNSMGEYDPFDPKKSQSPRQIFMLHSGSAMVGLNVSQAMDNKLQEYAFSLWDREKFVDITDWFFKEYAKRGRCIFDKEHHGWWIGEENRFTVINWHSRRCNWCGEWQTRTIKKEVRIKRHEIWTANAISH